MLRRLFPFFKEQDQRWEHLDHELTSAFGKVRADTQNLFSWITFFHKHLQDHHKETRYLKLKFTEQEREIAQLRAQMGQLQARLGTVEARPAQIVQVQPAPDPVQVNQIRTEPELNLNLKRARFETKMLNTIRTRKKPYIMQTILDTISQMRCSTKELERIIVDEKGLCGRTSFYAYLKELRLKKQISEAEEGFGTILVRS